MVRINTWIGQSCACPPPTVTCKKNGTTAYLVFRRLGAYLAVVRTCHGDYKYIRTISNRKSGHLDSRFDQARVPNHLVSFKMCTISSSVVLRKETSTCFYLRDVSLEEFNKACSRSTGHVEAEKYRFWHQNLNPSKPVPTLELSIDVLWGRKLN
jgi:hypothetical protein